MTYSSSIIKLFAIALVAWAVLGTTAAGEVSSLVLCILLFLLALLDAAQVVSPGAGREAALNDADIGALVRRLFSVAVGPFYLVLIILACVGLLGRQGPANTQLVKGMAAPAAASETTLCGGHGCGSAGGCGTSSCGASSGGACSCGGGSTKAGTHKPKPMMSTSEAKARADEVQKRSMAVPVANLPGIGPNARPLPPGVIPKPNIVLPPGAQKLMETSKAAGPPSPSSAATSVVAPGAPPAPSNAAPAATKSAVPNAVAPALASPPASTAPQSPTPATPGTAPMAVPTSTQAVTPPAVPPSAASPVSVTPPLTPVAPGNPSPP